MNSILPRFIAVLIVIAVFAKNASSASVKFDTINNFIGIGLEDADYRFENDENPDYSVFYKASKLSKSLAERNHAKIATSHDTLMNEDKLKADIEELNRNRVSYVQSRLDQSKISMKERIQTAHDFATSNQAVLNSIFDHTLGNDENSIGQLNAQIIRHKLTAPMKVIQSFLSFAITQHPQNAELDSKLIDLKQIIEQLTYKPRVIKVVLKDFDLLLEKESSKLVSVKQAIADLIKRADQILANKRVTTMRLMKILTIEWKDLQSVIESAKTQNAGEKPIVDLLNRLQGLTKCFELGIMAYKECKNNPTKLMTYSAHVNKQQDHLQKWEQYEQAAYGVLIPVLKEFEKLSDKEPSDKVDTAILSVLPKLDSVLVQLQKKVLYSNDVNRVIEDTKQLIYVATSLLNHIPIYKDQTTLVSYVEQIEKIGSKVPTNIKTLDGIITANLMLEMCMTTNEVLKMRVFPFDQDYMELCNVPVIRNPSKAKEHVKQNLLKNIETLKDKIAEASTILRPQDAVTMTSNMSQFTFYEWTSKDYKNEITKLLKGEKIILTTNATTTHENAFKFSQLLLDFIFVNKTKQSEFYKAINGYTVSMKMIGNNYLRCNKRLFYVPTDTNLFMQYRVGVNNTVASGNTLYKDLMNREPYLSVLSTWELQLVHPSSESGKLQGFIGDEIDLQMRGAFRYVLNKGVGQIACNSHYLSKNYKLDRILYEI